MRRPGFWPLYLDVKLNYFAEMLFSASAEITEKGQNHFFLEISGYCERDLPFNILTVVFTKSETAK